MKRWLSAALLLVLVAAGSAACGTAGAAGDPGAVDGGGGTSSAFGGGVPPGGSGAGEDTSLPDASDAPGTPEDGSLAGEGGGEAAACHFRQMARQAVQSLGLQGNESSVDKIKAAYRHVISLTTFIEYNQPELVDHWRYKDRCGRPPGIYQVMGAGPLLYGIGTCEQYSAALMLLLEEMGFAAQYVPGLTYSVQGTLVDHAWVMVEIDGQWYHIDPQLEDNVMRGDTIAYYYFLKGDSDFLAHHLWGSHLQQPDEYSLALPECPASLPWQPAEELRQDPRPDVDQLVQEAAREQAAFQGAVSQLEVEGVLPPLPSEMQP